LRSKAETSPAPTGVLINVSDSEVGQETSTEAAQLPVLPLRDVVVYPHMVIPLFVGREKSIDALDAAMSVDKRIMLAAQTSAAVDEPDDADIHKVGTIATILQLLKLPDGTIKVLVEGIQRAHIDSVVTSEEGYFLASYSFPEAEDIAEDDKDASRELDVLVRSVTNMFDQYVKMNKKVPPEILSSLTGVHDADRLADMIAAQMSLRVEEKQKILELFSARERLEHLLHLMESELDMLQVEKRIRGRVKQQMEKSQREYYLNEQMKAIQKELGEMDDVPNETEELARKIAKRGLSKEAKKKATAELNKLKMMSPMSAEATVVRNYVDTLVSLPWKKKSKLKKTLKEAEATLEHDHYGLDKVKERILEYLAVQKRVGHAKGPILCLVGPPGVGKTSLGKSIARATGRRFSRMALGGVRDEAEIRGHRRTYIGSMPGKIVQNLAKVKRRNPLILLDEIDKMSTDFRGDPSSALLEVLDPEQNHTFTDHYLEVEYDLSDVMFVATANTMNTREAGVRNLEREVSKICRKVVREVMELELAQKKQTNLDKCDSDTDDADKSETGMVKVDSDNLADYLGVPRHRYGRADTENQIGQVTGLAWTQVGGELLTIESTAVSGKGKLSSTGQLGDVMQESIQAAMMVVRSRAESLGIDADFHEKFDIHLHVPEGATPKDGPSAGVGMCTAMVSCFTEVPVKANVAMTGEITLRGEVLPIGGLKEKLLKSGLDIRPVRWIDEVLEVALASSPSPDGEQLVETVASTDGKPSGQSGSVQTH